jgi:trk system potassium uptake protein TrkH
MASSTGVEYIDIAATPVAAKILFILVGIAGGCAFSMAGGIKMKRIHQLVNALRRNSEEPTREELKSILIFIISFVVLLLFLSLAFSTVGISYLDSVFEVSSALTTNGVSMGITTITLPLGYKWLLIFAMIVGRVEIVNIFKMIRG